MNECRADRIADRRRGAAERFLLTLGLGVLLLSAVTGCATETSEPPVAMAASTLLDPQILDDPSRSEDDRKRDGGFKPLEIYEFFGVSAGDTVADLWPGRGYNTQILSAAVEAEGKVLAVLGPIYSRPQFIERIRGYLDERISAGQLENVEIVEALASLPDSSVDVMITVRNYHDLGEAEDRIAVLPELLRALKPGGILGVVDAVTSEPGRVEEYHRINEELVVSEITGAGFELVGRSPLLENPEDTYDFDGREDDPPIHRYFIHRFVHKYRKPMS